VARTFTRGGSRRKTQWAGMGNSSGAAALPTYITLTAGVASILSTGLIVRGASGLIIEGEVTITRMIAEYTAVLDSETADVQATMAIGCGLVRQEAIDVGVTALPSPEDDPDFEWLYYAVHGMRNEPVSALQTDISTLRKSLDVRGQRILRVGMNVVWLAETQTSNAFCVVGGRYLVKLA